ncbi:Gluconate transport-inducing protein [Collariella sp. IMI 366227]|nr:Gluconate transport-inducing protein [Collariella sp. IMI 366227]
MMETYYGQVRQPADAIKLFEACRLGLLPRVQRRLSEKERQQIRSGSVFVWDEREAGMRRWTDGKSWSASRVSGSFLTYREMEGKRGGNGLSAGSGRRGTGKTPESGRGSDEDHSSGEPDGYKYKLDGLMKQSFSITNSAGQHLHLIAYYSRNSTDDLQLPSMDPALRHIVPPKGMYPESSLAESAVPTRRITINHLPTTATPHTTTIRAMGGRSRRSGHHHITTLTTLTLKDLHRLLTGTRHIRITTLILLTGRQIQATTGPLCPYHNPIPTHSFPSHYHPNPASPCPTTLTTAPLPAAPTPRLPVFNAQRSQQLQAQARDAVQIETRLAPIDAARNQQHSTTTTINKHKKSPQRSRS